MQLGPNNSEMQRSQRNLTVGAFSVLMPFVAVVQAFVVMGFLRWAWRAKRWLLALVAMLAIAASVLAGLDWMQNHAGDRLHLSDEQRPGRVRARSQFAQGKLASPAPSQKSCATLKEVCVSAEVVLRSHGHPSL